MPAYFAIDMLVADRTYRIPRPTSVFGDILREPEPGRTEWFGRVALTVHPGSASSGIATAAMAPVLSAVQPYGGRIALGAMVIGPQGEPGGFPYQTAIATGGTCTLDIALGAYAKVALNAPSTLALAGGPEPFETGRLTVELDIAAGATVTAWPAGTLWAGGTAPVLSAGPAKDLIVFTSIDGGATIFGHLVGQGYAPA